MKDLPSRIVEAGDFQNMIVGDKIMKRHIANGRDDLFVKKAGKTTLAAWEPYWEVLGIYFSFNHQECDDEHPEWRMMWLSQVTLLRVIGHVLAKVDVETSTLHKRAINDMWAKWKVERGHNWIFWDFIEDERNNLLKAYQFGVEVDEKGLFHDTLDMDGHQLLREAIYWWRDQLEELELAL
ncbi:hypothetical protein [Rhizobium bangladeshense]|uniref:hypothetical protein n=1 Tax=Rhizobium bangladeshense TaxID=1138189 RepID=UPI0018D290E8|nr:hypothetical protein [Rhizobium bangladeshense]